MAWGFGARFWRIFWPPLGDYFGARSHVYTKRKASTRGKRASSEPAWRDLDGIIDRPSDLLYT